MRFKEHEMTENKGDDLVARREWAMEAAAKDLGISVGEFKRRLALDRELRRARDRGASEWEIDAIKNCGTDVIQAIVRDQQNAPRSPSQAGASGQITKTSTNAGLVGANTTGWRNPTPIKNGLGQGK
jgi:hypothetical protein